MALSGEASNKIEIDYGSISLDYNDLGSKSIWILAEGLLKPRDTKTSYFWHIYLEFIPSLNEKWVMPKLYSRRGAD